VIIAAFKKVGKFISVTVFCFDPNTYNGCNIIMLVLSFRMVDGFLFI
jgi:hypothetical protein